ncbi:MAG: hypothetical protein ACRYG4_09295 [Janthinobacterium lividum]
MIARIWHGWTTPANAEAYQHLFLTSVVPDVEARAIAGFLQIDVLRRDVVLDGSDAVEFTTIMAFDTIEAIERFMGADPTIAHVPPETVPLLLRFDERAVHYDVLERRPQTELARGRP